MPVTTIGDLSDMNKLYDAYIVLGKDLGKLSLENKPSHEEYALRIKVQAGIDNMVHLTNKLKEDAKEHWKNLAVLAEKNKIIQASKDAESSRIELEEEHHLMQNNKPDKTEPIAEREHGAKVASENDGMQSNPKCDPVGKESSLVAEIMYERKE